MRGLILKSLLTLLLLSLVLSSLTVAREFTFELHREIPVGEAPALYLSNISGKIIIRSHAQEKITLNALKVIKTSNLEKAQELAEKIKIEIEVDGEKINIRTEYPRSGFLRGFSAWVNYEISVPPKTQLNIKTTSADAEIEGVEQKIRVNTVSGDLQAEMIKGNINFTSVSGDLFLQDIQGDLFLKGTSSDVESEGIKGDIRIDCVSGDIELCRINGDIDASTTSGDMDIEQDRGGLNLGTISGDIEVRTKISPESEYNIETTSGEIFFYLPEDSDAGLECESHSGSIKTRIPLKLLSTSRNYLDGELGSGGPRIHLSTVSGDIQVRGY